MFLPIFSIAIGLFFAVFGVRIVIFNQFHLISDYTPDKGRKYALRVGLIELSGGALCILCGIIGCFLQNDIFSYVSLFLTIGALILALSFAGRKK